MIRPITLVLWLRIPRAAKLDAYPKSWTTASTFLEVFSEISSLPLMTRETVVTETPAFLATSRMVMDLGFLLMVILGIVSGNVIVIIDQRRTLSI